MSHLGPIDMPFRIWNKTDWSKFAGLIDGKLKAPACSLFESKVDLENNVTYLTKNLLESQLDCCPLIRPSRKKYPVWWSKEVQSLRSESRRQFNKARKSGNYEEWDLYKDKLRLFKKAIISAKKESWEHMCASIEGVKETARLRKLL